MAVRHLYGERELFRRMAEGEELAFRAFFDLNKSRLFRFMLGISKSEAVAEELTHDVFLKIWTNRSSLSAVENPGKYIFTIARNTAVDHLRKVASEAKMLDQLWSDMNETHDPTGELMEATESERLIREAIERLTPQKQLIFRLSREEGMNHERIAAQLNISKSTVNNHLVQSLRAIRQYLHIHNADTRP